MVVVAVSGLVHFPEEFESSDGAGVGVFDGVFFGVVIELLEDVGAVGFAVEGAIGVFGVLGFTDDFVGAVVVAVGEFGVGVGGEEGGGCFHYN
jgi:hypothetical protein